MSDNVNTSPEANPFAFKRRTDEYEPALNPAAVQELRERIANLPPEKADAVVKQVEEEIKKEQSGGQTLQMIFGLVGKGIGLFV